MCPSNDLVEEISEVGSLDRPNNWKLTLLPQEILFFCGVSFFFSTASIGAGKDDFACHFFVSKTKKSNKRKMGDAGQKGDVCFCS